MKNEIFIEFSSFFQLMNNLFNNFRQLLNDFVIDENFLTFFDMFYEFSRIFQNKTIFSFD